MTDDFSAIIASPPAAEGYVELGSRGTTGKVFRKHVLNLGQLHYQGKTFELGEPFWEQLKKNFDSGVTICQVPLADAKNAHTEDPMRNAGEVVGLERDGDRIYTLIDVRDPDVAQRIADKRILGASAMISMNYADSRTGKRVGPALLHHCLTNRPHVLDLEPYTEVVAATADFADPVMLGYPGADPDDDEAWEETAGEPPVTLDPGPEPVVLADVPAGGPDSDAALLLAELGNMLGLTAEEISGEVRGVLCLTGGESPEEVAASVVMLAAERDEYREQVLRLSAVNGELCADLAREKRERAEAVVAGFIGEGRLYPKTRDRAVSVYLTDGQDGLDELLSPASDPLIQLNAQSGMTGTGDDAGMQQAFDIDAEITRLGNIANRGKK